ncbi:MAG: hypothetical protein JZU47_11000 [Prolixibacteraceae bacterium]|nr:hypothetical protein [Prolixibacteraceae bacterium]
MKTEIIEKVAAIKKETGAIKVYVDDRYSNPLMIPLYNEVQVEFLKEVLTSWSIFSELLIKLFETKSASIEDLRNMYTDMIDFD